MRNTCFIYFDTMYILFHVTFYLIKEIVYNTGEKKHWSHTNRSSSSANWFYDLEWLSKITTP